MASLLPPLDRRVWLLSAGRLLSQIGNGFTLVYAPIFFANQVGLSATAVGIGIGAGSIAGIIGRFLGGTGADDPQWGRRRILLWSAAISALADGVLAIAFNFPTFLLGNIVMGFGIGLYWPATEAMVADLTTDQQRNEAFALVRWADQVGLSLGIILGGVLLELTGMYRALFVIDGITYLAFFGLLYGAIAETLPDRLSRPPIWTGWGIALRDSRLQIYIIINSLLTLYLAQIQSTLPLYFTKFVRTAPSAPDVAIPMVSWINVQSSTSGIVPHQVGFSTALIGLIFTWNVVLTALLQLPVARLLNRLSRTHALSLSALAWGLGFCGIFLTGMATTGVVWWAGLSLGIMAIATVIYLPSASAYVVDMAPESLRGIYLSLNAQCWAIGYFLGPSLGGWVLDQGAAIAHPFWLGLALSVAIVITLLGQLDQLQPHRH
ncbi:MAG: MFS transporter [Merismopedia sp. SIO2A8]|nr:MFS transporter [Merismopedia sp. SIO2A8]